VKDPSALRHQHLLGLCEATDDRGDADWSTIILEILTREQERKKWRRIIYTTWPPRGGNSLSVCVQSGPIVHTTPRQRSWNIPQTISLSVSIWPTLHHVTVCNYSTSLGLWVTQNAHNRSLKVHMITHPIPTFGQRRSCRKPNIPSHACLARRLLPQYLLQISNKIGGGLMKGHHHHLAVLPSPITRLWHLA
jgi:hypothetical protein